MNVAAKYVWPTKATKYYITNTQKEMKLYKQKLLLIVKAQRVAQIMCCQKSIEIHKRFDHFQKLYNPNVAPSSGVKLLLSIKTNKQFLILAKK